MELIFGDTKVPGGPSEADGFWPLLAVLRALCLLSQCMSDGARGIKAVYSRLTQSEFI